MALSYATLFLQKAFAVHVNFSLNPGKNYHEKVMKLVDQNLSTIIVFIIHAMYSFLSFTRKIIHYNELFDNDLCFDLYAPRKIALLDLIFHFITSFDTNN